MNEVVKEMNRVVHFGIPVDDMERAKKFYSIFGWDLEDMSGMDYVQVKTVPVDENQVPTEPGAINGGMMKRTEGVNAPVIALHVDSIDKYIEKVESCGGKVVRPKVELVNKMGYYAYVSDTEGNVIGLWETV